MGHVGFSLLLDKPGDVEPLAQFAPSEFEALAGPICSLATAAPKWKFAFQPGWIRELNLVLESLVCPLLQSLVLLKQLTFSHCNNLLHVAPLLDSHDTFLLRGIEDLLDSGSNVSQVRFRGKLKVLPNVTIWHHNSKEAIIIIIADSSTFSLRNDRSWNDKSLSRVSTIGFVCISEISFVLFQGHLRPHFL